MLSGVTIENAAQTTIDYGAKIGRDSVVRPFTIIDGSAVIGENCVIEPFTHVVGPCSIQDGTRVK